MLRFIADLGEELPRIGRSFVADPRRSGGSMRAAAKVAPARGGARARAAARGLEARLVTRGPTTSSSP